MSYRTATSESSEDTSESSDNSYCIFLHIAEGVGLQRSRGNADCQHDQIVMHASLNTVKFEIEGHSTETVTIFNSNCIWECGLNDLKRMKTENRPVRIACFLNNGTSNSPPFKSIGTLLLPIRGVPTITTLRNYQPKMLWHKLGALCTEWRTFKPEIYLLIVVVKKSLVHDNSFNALLGKKSVAVRSSRSSETAGMLQSQSNVYVQLIEQLGLIQVGNNPDVDCDIFLVMLTLKRAKDLAKLISVESSENTQNKFVFQYELFGSATQDEITIDASDSYALNQKIALKFKASLHSLKLYFQRIFYIPIVIYYNGHAIATYRFDCSKFFPEMGYFDSSRLWNKNGCFVFDRLHKMLSPRATKPSVDFTFSLQLLEKFSKKCSKEIVPLRDTFVTYKIDEGASGDGKSDHPTARSTKSKCTKSSAKTYNRAKSDPSMIYTSPETTTEEYQKDDVEIAVETIDACIDTEDLSSSSPSASSSHVCADIEKFDICIDTEDLIITATNGINTEPNESSNDIETLTIKMIKELEAWKAQQMSEFREKLERKEIFYLRNLEKDWQKEHYIQQTSLDEKNLECDELRKQLDQTKIELEARKLEDIIAAKHEVEQSYVQKIQKLEFAIKHWKIQLQKQHQFSVAEKQAMSVQQQEILKMQQENQVLKKNIANLEHKLISLGKTHFSADELKDMMTDMRQQTERFANVEKQRNFYKDKLARATRELQQLKLSLLKQQEMNLLRNGKDSTDDLDLSFGDISRAEKVVFTNKRVEPKIESSKMIKEMILKHAESTTSYDDIESVKSQF